MKLNELPVLGALLDAGIFAGVITQKDGTHVAVVLLLECCTKLAWGQAMEWAQKQGGVLPTSPIAAMLFANVKASLPRGGHWTSEEDDEEASFAWICNFYDGTQFSTRKRHEAAAVAVRLITIE